MGIKKQAEEAVSELESIATDSWTEEDRHKVNKIIEEAIIKTVHEFCDTSVKGVNESYGADRDKAHKLNEEILNARNAIIANLSSLR